MISQAKIRSRLAVWLTIALCAAGCEKRIEVPAAIDLPVITTKTGIKMVLVPSGSFLMGNNTGKEDERPAHRIQLDAFLMDTHEITQENYEKMALPNPSHFKGPANPVEMISWAQAAMFCNARSHFEGLEPCYDEDTGKSNFQAAGYRLPTEAEWEYACRAGSERDYFFGADQRLLAEYGWFADNASKKSHPIGEKKPNPWGLYDMYGNVAEWCNDIYDPNYYKTSPAENPRGPTDGDKYVLRGGGWNSNAGTIRSSYRVGETPGFQDACFARDAIGFRCVRKAPPTPAE